MRHLSWSWARSPHSSSCRRRGLPRRPYRDCPSRSASQGRPFVPRCLSAHGPEPFCRAARRRRQVHLNDVRGALSIRRAERTKSPTAQLGREATRRRCTSAVVMTTHGTSSGDLITRERPPPFMTSSGPKASKRDCVGSVRDLRPRPPSTRPRSTRSGGAFPDVGPPRKDPAAGTSSPPPLWSFLLLPRRSFGGALLGAAGERFPRNDSQP